jgi:hypothetical protein
MVSIGTKSVFHRKLVSFTWKEISHVYCRSEDVGAISSIIVVANDGRRIGLGNTGGVDFASMYELKTNSDRWWYITATACQNCRFEKPIDARHIEAVVGLGRQWRLSIFRAIVPPCWIVKDRKSSINVQTDAIDPSATFYPNP